MPGSKSIISRRNLSLHVPSYHEIMDKLRLKKFARPYKQIRWEDFFRRSLVIIALAMVVLVMGIFLTLVVQSIPSLKALGIQYLWGKTWNPVTNVYGAFPFLLGTLLTSFLALIISIPFSFAIAIYLGEYNSTGWLSNFLKNTVELIAAVPSVMYGFLGFFFFFVLWWRSRSII